MRYQGKLQTLIVLICLSIVTAIFAMGAVSKTLTALKAAQIIESQLNKDIEALANEVLSIHNTISDLKKQRDEMIQTRDELWYIANEAYTEYCGAMLGQNSDSAETASYYWRIYKNAIQAIKYWKERIELIEYDIQLTTEVYLNPKNEELKQKRKELDDTLKEIDRLNAEISGDQTPDCSYCTEGCSTCQ